MTRSVLLCTFCFITCLSHAQVRGGILAGYNSTKWKYTVTPGNWETSNEAISSFNAGVLGQLVLTNHIRLQGSFLFNGAGTKLRERYRFNSSTRTIRLYSFNLPILAIYHVDVKKMRFGMGGGFYGAYMLFGTEKGTTEQVIFGAPTVTKPVDNRIEFVESSNQRFDPSITTPFHINPFDVGYVVMASVEFDRLYLFQVSYNAGLKDVLPGGYFHSGNFRNRVISLSLAMWLSYKKL